MNGKYYDHDPDWSRRAGDQEPAWGPWSRRVYQGLLDLIRNESPPPAAFFDAGCGAGLMGQFATAAGYTYTGADASQVAVDLGKRSWPGLDIHCFDFLTPELPDRWRERFDVVTAVNSLHCITADAERRQFIANLRGALRPGGLVAVTTMCAPVLEGFQPSRTPRAYKSREEITAEFTGAGFVPAAELFEPATPTARISNLTWLGRRN